MNPHISDLFFNLDHSGENPSGEGRDPALIREKAVWFLDTLQGAGLRGPILPSPADLVEDFLKRL